jgi:hypothetical protein
MVEPDGDRQPRFLYSSKYSVILKKFLLPNSIYNFGFEIFVSIGLQKRTHDRPKTTLLFGSIFSLSSIVVGSIASSLIPESNREN